MRPEWRAAANIKSAPPPLQGGGFLCAAPARTPTSARKFGYLAKRPLLAGVNLCAGRVLRPRCATCLIITSTWRIWGARRQAGESGSCLGREQAALLLVCRMLIRVGMHYHHPDFMNAQFAAHKAFVDALARIRSHPRLNEHFHWAAAPSASLQTHAHAMHYLNQYLAVYGLASDPALPFN